MSDQPNILSNQHNAKCMGMALHPMVQSPNLDRPGSEGVRLTSAITQSPICTPSRVSFFSGQYPHNHGHYGTPPDTGMAPCTLPTLPGHRLPGSGRPCNPPHPPFVDGYPVARLV